MSALFAGVVVNYVKAVSPVVWQEIVTSANRFITSMNTHNPTYWSKWPCTGNLAYVFRSRAYMFIIAYVVGPRKKSHYYVYYFIYLLS